MTTRNALHAPQETAQPRESLPVIGSSGTAQHTIESRRREGARVATRALTTAAGQRPNGAMTGPTRPSCTPSWKADPAGTRSTAITTGRCAVSVTAHLTTPAAFLSHGITHHHRKEQHHERLRRRP